MIDFRDTLEEAEFRQRLQRWVDRVLRSIELPAEADGRDKEEGDWHRLLYSEGWMGLSWPVEYGGKGLSPVYEAILNDVLGDAGAPPPPAIGFLGRALQMFGTEEQKRRFLPGLLSGEVQWCQGFSEPDAGSDLASLKTRAVRVGEEYRVSGQKVWTSRAAWADWCLLLVRTDPEAPKHKGISCLVIDMKSPGIEVRPLLQVTGSTRFAEVFFDEAPVPVSQRIGNEGDGWTIAMTTVKYERGPADNGYVSRFRRVLGHMEDLQRRGQLPPAAAEALGRLYAHIEILRVHVLTGLAKRARGEIPGPESSVDKILMIRTEQAIGNSIIQLLQENIAIGDNPELMYDYLRSRAASILGGTEQIQKNIVATRVLGLGR